MNILICGHRSFAANGLADLLREDGHVVTCFSRGLLDRQKDVVTGDVYELGSNPYLANTFDVVINFIIIKDGTIEDNVRYVKTLSVFAEKCGARLIHISSISVYPNDIQIVDENSPIERDLAKKGTYARLKLVADLTLENVANGVTFVRPGFIVTDGQSPSLAGIVKPLPFVGGGVLLGGRETPLPLVRRECFHRALRVLVGNAVPPRVCLIFANRGDTKWTFVKAYFKRHVVVMPTWLVKAVVSVARHVRVLSFSTACQILGLFKTTLFDSTKTESLLNMRFG